MAPDCNSRHQVGATATDDEAVRTQLLSLHQRPLSSQLAADDDRPLLAGWRRPCSCPNFDDLIQCLASEGEGLRRDLPPRVPLCGAGSPIE